MQELRHESPETEARNECLVLEALAELKHASAKAIAHHSGLTYNAAILALRRQRGFCVEKVAGGWGLLEEPANSDREVFPHKRTQKNQAGREAIEQQLKFYLSEQGLDFSEAIFCRDKIICLYPVSASELQIGDYLVVLRKNGKSKGQKSYRRIYGIYLDEFFIRFELNHGTISIPSRYYRPDEIVLSRMDVKYENGKITPC